MTHEQITQCLKSVSVILDVIASAPGFKAIAANPYGHPDIDTSLGDAQHYVAELLYKLESQQETSDRTAGTDSPSIKHED